jgi:hypothetical protein
MKLPLVAHWALRVEKEPGQGDDNDPLTWNYFAIVGKLDENGQRQLRYDRRQFHPTYLGPLGKTTQSEENIDWLGRDLVRKAEPYQLILNDCQVFVKNLWIHIDDYTAPWEDPYAKYSDHSTELGYPRPERPFY